MSISGCRREMETADNCLIAPMTSRVIRMPSFGCIYDAPTLIRPTTHHQLSRAFPPPFCSRTLVKDRTGAFLRTANLKEHQRCDKGPALLIIRRASYGMSSQKSLTMEINRGASLVLIYTRYVVQITKIITSF